MKIVLIMNHNSYPGREYLSSILKAKIIVDVISIGNFRDNNELEDIRCNNLWKPTPFDDLIVNFKHYNFDTLKSNELEKFLMKMEYDIGIQGGTGIIRNNIINKFKYGILNFHPGDLPKFRGCSAPEWQLFEGLPVISTCHLVDSGIDTGPIYSKKELDIDRVSYYAMRSSIYPQTALFVVEVLEEIISYNGFKKPLFEQDGNEAVYRKYIGDDKIEQLKDMLKS